MQTTVQGNWDMQAEGTEKLSSSEKRTKEREEVCDEKKVRKEKEDIVKTQGYVMKKRRTTEGRGEEGEGGEVETGKGNEDEKARTTKAKDGDGPRGYQNTDPGGHEEDRHSSVKRDDVNAGEGDGGERKTGGGNARAEGKQEQEEEDLMEEVLTAVGLGRWQVPLILTAFISKYTHLLLNSSVHLDRITGSWLYILRSTEQKLPKSLTQVLSCF